MEKLCSKCKQLKPLDAFGPSKRTRTGRTSSCYECNAAYQRQRYANDAEYRARKKAQTARVQKAAIYRETMRACQRRWERAHPMSKERLKARREKYGATYPERQAARNELRNAMLRGEIKRQPCMICQSAKSEAHHPDYSKPLDVMWFCKLHHRAWERLFRDAVWPVKNYQKVTQE